MRCFLPEGVAVRLMELSKFYLQNLLSDQMCQSVPLYSASESRKTRPVAVLSVRVGGVVPQTQVGCHAIRETALHHMI